MPRKAPGLAGVVAFQLGTGHGGWGMGDGRGGGTSTVVSDRFFSAAHPGLKLSRKSALPWLALRTAYNFGTPAPPPQFHRIPFPPVLTLHFRRSSPAPVQDHAPTTIATNSGRATQRYPLHTSSTNPPNSKTQRRHAAPTQEQAHRAPQACRARTRARPSHDSRHCGAARLQGWTRH